VPKNKTNTKPTGFGALSRKADISGQLCNTKKAVPSISNWRKRIFVGKEAVYG
jgi:hypothetical protein